MFPKVLAIISLALCFIRGTLGLFGIIGTAVLFEQAAGEINNSILIAGAEVVSALFIAVFGIIANILILLKKRAALPLAWLMVFFTILSICVGVATVAQQILIASGGTPDFTDPQTIGMVIGAGLMLLIRLAILVSYIAALVVFSRWINGSTDQITP